VQPVADIDRQLARRGRDTHAIERAASAAKHARSDHHRRGIVEDRSKALARARVACKRAVLREISRELDAPRRERRVRDRAAVRLENTAITIFPEDRDQLEACRRRSLLRRVFDQGLDLPVPRRLSGRRLCCALRELAMRRGARLRGPVLCAAAGDRDDVSGCFGSQNRAPCRQLALRSAIIRHRGEPEIAKTRNQVVQKLGDLRNRLLGIERIGEAALGGRSRMNWATPLAPAPLITPILKLLSCQINR